MDARDRRLPRERKKFMRDHRTFRSATYCVKVYIINRQVLWRALHIRYCFNSRELEKGVDNVQLLGTKWWMAMCAICAYGTLFSTFYNASRMVHVIFQT